VIWRKPLVEQLKALFLKQELSRFACEHQGKDAASVQSAFRAFVERVQIDPTSAAGLLNAARVESRGGGHSVA